MNGMQGEKPAGMRSSRGGAGMGWRRVVLLALPLVAAAGAGCFGTVFYDLGPNHPPNTIFLDGSSFPTPADDVLLRSDTVSFYYNGVDQVDGDAMAYYRYRLTPRDSEWTQTTANHVTFTGLLDTTYDFCVYAVDARGAADPNPTCRTFRVKAIHLGSIEETDWVSERTGELVFDWDLSQDSQFQFADFFWQLQLVDYLERTDPYGHDSVDSTSARFTAPSSKEYRVLPEPGHLYRLSIFARNIAEGDSLSASVCYPRNPE